MGSCSFHLEFERSGSIPVDMADPTKRWEEKSSNCSRDQVIKVLGLVALGAAGVASSIYLGIMVPVAILTAKHASDAAILTSVFLMTFGIPGFASAGIGGAVALGCCVCDWTDYSDKEVVFKISVELTSKPLNELAETYKSSSWEQYKLSQYKRYGILSEESANELQKYADRFAEIQDKVTKLGSHVKTYEQYKTSSEQNIIIKRLVEAHNIAKAEQATLLVEFNKFQKSLAYDLPAIVPA